MKLCEKSLFEGNETFYDYSLRFGDDANLMYPALLASSRVVVMKDAFTTITAMWRDRWRIATTPGF